MSFARLRCARIRNPKIKCARIRCARILIDPMVGGILLIFFRQIKGKDGIYVVDVANWRNSYWLRRYHT